MTLTRRETVLSLCDRTGIILKPWSEAGYRCIAVDIQHPEGVTLRDGIEYTGADVRSYLPPLADYVLCVPFPPCTHLAVSGARWFAEKGLSALHEAIGLVEACRRICEWSEAAWFIENPVSTLSTYWRKPDHFFDPCEYAGYLADPAPEAYTKRTCLWAGGGFLMPERRGVVPLLGSKMHLMPPSEDRADLRSETPEGFARAVFETMSANGKRAAA